MVLSQTPNRTFKLRSKWVWMDPCPAPCDHRPDSAGTFGLVRRRSPVATQAGDRVGFFGPAAGRTIILWRFDVYHTLIVNKIMHK